MINIYEFNRVNLKLLREDISQALKTVSAKYGIGIELNNISYNASTATGKLSLQIMQTESGERPLTPDEKAFNEIAPILGIPVKLHEEFTPRVGKLERVKFTGYITRRGKYPFIIQDIKTGSRFKISTDHAIAITKVIE